jgi:hypothetical protein
MRVYQELTAPHRVDLNNKIADYHSQYPVVYGVQQGEVSKSVDENGNTVWSVRMSRYRSAD